NSGGFLGSAPSIPGPLHTSSIEESSYVQFRQSEPRPDAGFSVNPGPDEAFNLAVPRSPNETSAMQDFTPQYPRTFQPQGAHVGVSEDTLSHSLYPKTQAGEGQFDTRQLTTYHLALSGTLTESQFWSCDTDTLSSLACSAPELPIKSSVTALNPGGREVRKGRSMGHQEDLRSSKRLANANKRLQKRAKAGWMGPTMKRTFTLAKSLFVNKCAEEALYWPCQSSIDFQKFMEHAEEAASLASTRTQLIPALRLEESIRKAELQTRRSLLAQRAKSGFRNAYCNDDPKPIMDWLGYDEDSAKEYNTALRFLSRKGLDSLLDQPNIGSKPPGIILDVMTFTDGGRPRRWDSPFCRYVVMDFLSGKQGVAKDNPEKFRPPHLLDHMAIGYAAVLCAFRSDDFTEERYSLEAKKFKMALMADLEDPHRRQDLLRVMEEWWIWGLERYPLPNKKSGLAMSSGSYAKAPSDTERALRISDLQMQHLLARDCRNTAIMHLPYDHTSVPPLTLSEQGLLPLENAPSGSQAFSSHGSFGQYSVSPNTIMPGSSWPAGFRSAPTVESVTASAYSSESDCVPSQILAHASEWDRLEDEDHRAQVQGHLRMLRDYENIRRGRLATGHFFTHHHVLPSAASVEEEGKDS
ncbi:hypothetical protein CVT26_012861, partial [Gymnopilus dilepis]